MANDLPLPQPIQPDQQPEPASYVGELPKPVGTSANLLSEDGRYEILDGDTIRDTSTGENIRLAQLNTSETAKHDSMGQFMSQEAKRTLKDYVDRAGKDLQIKRSGTDPYGRSIAELVDGGNGASINSQLVRRGLAEKKFYNGESSTFMDHDRRVALKRYLIESDDPIMQQIKANQQQGAYHKFQFREPDRTVLQTFGDSFARGVDNMQASLYAAANAFGELTGIDVIAEWGEDGTIRNMKEAAMNPAEVKSWDEVDSLASFGTYVIETLGEQAPNLISMASGAGAAATLARAAIGKAALKTFSKRLLAKTAPALGTGAVSYPLAVGEVQSELKDGGIHAPGTAFLAGIPIAGLDAISFNFMLGHLFGNVVEKQAASNMVDTIGKEFFKQLGIQAGKGAVKGALAEIPTEMAQELIQISARAMHDPEYEILSTQNLKRIREAGIKAGIVGFAAGGAGGAGGHVLNTEFSKPAQKTAANEAPSAFDPKAPFGPSDGKYDMPGTTEVSVPGAEFQAPGTQSEVPSTAPAQESTIQQELPLPTPINKESVAAQPDLPKPITSDEGALGVKKVKLAQQDASETAQPVDSGLSTAGATSLYHSTNARVLESDGNGNPVMVGNTRVGWKPQPDGSPSDSLMNRVQKLRDKYPDHDFGVVETQSNGETRHLIEEVIPPKGTGAEVEDSVLIREAIQKMHDDGKRTEDKRLIVKSPFKDKDRINAGEISKIGQIVNGFREGKPMEILRDNFMSGVAYLMDKGYDFNNALKPGTVVAKMGGRNITFSELSKVKGTQYLADVDLDTIEQVSEVERSTQDNSRAARSLESEDKQAGKSAKDVAPGKSKAAKRATRISSTSVGTTWADGSQVQVTATSLPNNTAKVADALLKHIGLNTRVRVMDEDGVARYIEALKSENSDVSKTKIASLEKLLKEAPLGRILYNDIFSNLEDRIPTIFVSMNAKDSARQLTILSHEMGHLVQRAALDTAPKEVQQKLHDAYEAAGDRQVFAEWFANQLYMWVLSRKEPSSILDKFFHGMVNKLRRMWAFMKRKYGGPNFDATFAEFMDGMVGVRMSEAGEKGPATSLGKEMQSHLEGMVRSPSLPKRAPESLSHADFTPDQLIDTVKDAAKKVKGFGLRKLTATRRGQKVADLGADTVSSIVGGLNVVARSNDSWLRGLKSAAATWLANQFHRRPGDTTRGATIYEEIRRISGPLHTRLETLGNMMPRKKNKAVDIMLGLSNGRLDKNNPRYREISDALLLEKYSIEELKAMGLPEAAAVREYLDDVLQQLQDIGMEIGKVKNFFPHLIDVAKVTENEDVFRAKLKSELGLSGKQADKLITRLKQSNGTEFVIPDVVTAESDTAAPVFGSMKHRALNSTQQASFKDFYQDDVMGILHYYTDAAVRRAVFQKRFNPDNIRGVDGNVDPMLLFNEKMQRALDTGELTREEVTRIKDAVMPAYMGRLGANGPQWWRSFSGTMVTYQNVRLLSFVVLTSLVDAGYTTYRSGDVFALPRAVKQLLNSSTREELYEQAKIIGAIRDDLTEHVLNDPVTQQYISSDVNQWNEYFFRFVRMHQWTNFTRVAALATGKHYLTKHATRAAGGDKISIRALDELGVTADEVLNDPNFESEVMQDTLNRFIDESVLRPDATQRPPWASDPNWMIFSHLKSFMWSYSEIILRRLWADMRNQDTAAKMALPVLFLAMSTLPLAALGYELRRRIGYAGTPPKNVDLEGWDYFWEVLQRSGALGIFQLYADADQAEEFGRFSIISLMGPTMSQFEEFLTKDFGYSLPRAAPGLAQLPALRSWMRSEFF